MDTQIMASMVTEFHLKHGFPAQREPLAVNGREDIPALIFLGHDFKKISQKWCDVALEFGVRGDHRFYRAVLMIEELGELLLGLGSNDKELIVDGATDLMYVLIGSFGVTYSFPWDEAFAEVHKSNMTKSRRVDNLDRMRDKGPNYRPPNWKRVFTGETVNETKIGILTAALRCLEPHSEAYNAVSTEISSLKEMNDGADLRYD